MPNSSTPGDSISSNGSLPRKFVGGKFLTHWIPALCWMGLIFYLSSRPGDPLLDLGSLDFSIKKLAHVIEYAFLYFLLFRTINTFASPRPSFIFAAAIAILYAVSDEFHQTFVPLREGRARDVMIDSLGVFLMYLYLRHRLLRLPQ